MRFACYFCPQNLRSEILSCNALRMLVAYLALAFSAGACGNALRVLLLYPKFAILQPKLWQRSFRTIFLYLRVLLWYLKLANFEPTLRECSLCTSFVFRNRDFAAGALGMECSLRTTFVYRSCEFRAGAAGVRFAYYFCT